MTLLIAVRTDDYALLGSDTGQLFGDDKPPAPFFTWDSRVQVHKSAASGALAWATSGAPHLAGGFDNWMRGTVFNSWDELTAQVGEKVAEMNRQSRTQAKRAGTPTKDTPFVNIEVAGHIGGSYDTVLFAYEGTVIRCSDTDFHYQIIGPYSETVRVAWHVLTEFDGSRKLEDPTTLRRFMESMVDHLPLLGKPIEIWKLTAAGAEAV